MKKRVFALVLAIAMVAAMLVGCFHSNAGTNNDYKIAMITDSGDITDQSFNQATYEACKAFADSKKLDFRYYKPTDDSDDARIAAFKDVVEDGYNVVVVPGYLFANMIKAVAADNPDVTIVALDISADDLGDEYTLPSNVCTFTYQEELAGYMAGYAVVKEGYRKLGFLGGVAIPSIERYGYGFIQGANDAAKEMNVVSDIEVKFVYGGKFSGDPTITACMETWYSSGTEIIFSCGGGIYTSACEAAVKADGKVVGVDVDQAVTLNESYGEGICVTSAMKGLGATVTTTLQDIVDGKFSSRAGKITNLGLVSADDITLNYVQLPTDSWSMTNFTQNDYKSLVRDMVDGKITVSSSIDAMPTTDITVTVFDNIQ